MKRFINQRFLNIKHRCRLFSFKISSDPNDSVKNKFKQVKANLERENISFNELMDTDINANFSSKHNLNNQDIFYTEGKKYLNKLQKAFSDIDDNSITIEEINSTFLTVKAGKIGLYIFKIEEDGFLTMTSPVSGYFKYVYNPNINFWINVKDEHIIDDLLIREFCKHSKGMLSIE